MRLDVALVVAFWCLSLTVTVIQQSSLLGDLGDLWRSRLATERSVAARLARVSSALDAARLRRQHGAAAVDSEAGDAVLASADNNTRSVFTLAALGQLEKEAIDLAERLTARLAALQAKPDAKRQATKRHDVGGADQQDGARPRAHDGSNNPPPPLPPLAAMRTSCGDYGASEALRHLVDTMRDRLYESDATGLLSQYAGGAGGAAGAGGLSAIRMDSALSNQDVQIEAVLDHLEETMPRVLEAWPRWFRQDGRRVPAPPFVPPDVAVTHPSVKAGRAAYEASLKK